SPLTTSALYACIPDCFTEFARIYDELLPALVESSRTPNYAQLLEHMDELGGPRGRLQHFALLLDAAAAGFAALLRIRVGSELDLKSTQTRWVLGLIDDGQLPNLAADLLIQGIESKSLVELAGLSRKEPGAAVLF